MNNVIFWQWILLGAFGLCFFLIVPGSKSLDSFFKAKSENGREPGILLLTSSLVISWIFAKSITNAANLGQAYGLTGGLAYAIYYLSFITAGVIIYRLRVSGGFSSIHHFLSSRYGRTAVLVFSILIGIRLFNEVWSNTMVIGSYFGEAGTVSYYIAILLFTGLTLAYSLKGGLRSSILTDAIQMFMFSALLILLLSYIFRDSQSSIHRLITPVRSGNFGAVNLLLVAFVQIFSYPFHDPVMTDRGFLTNEKVTLHAFLLAGAIGFICILLFSLIGVYMQTETLESDAAVQFSRMMGAGSMLTMNFIMITSAASTLDSTFSSFSKLAIIDLKLFPAPSLKAGRLCMLILVVLGTIPIFLGAEILSATTISGTMVLGLAPVFLFWKWKMPVWSFYLPVGFGLLIGLLVAFGLFPKILILTQGKYADLLWSNIWGSLTIFILFFSPKAISKIWTKRKPSI